MEVEAANSTAVAKVPPPRSILARILIALLIFAGLLCAILLLTAGGVVWWMRTRHAAALQAVANEVARAHDAREPITTLDCYDFQSALSKTPEITATWMAVVESFDEKELSRESRLLIAGNSPDEKLRPGAPDSTNSAVQVLLLQFDDTLQATHAEARESGQCSLRVAFEDGLNAKLDHVQSLRSIARLR